LGQTWCKISRLFDRFFVSPFNLHLGVGSRRSPVFVSFLGVFIFRRFGVLAPGFLVLYGGCLRCLPPVAGPLRVSTASCYHRHPPRGFSTSSPRLFSFRLCFLCFRSVFVFALFLCSCFFVFSAALLIFSLLDLPPSVHCRAFPCDPSATSFNAPYTGRIRLLRDWLFSVLLVFSVCILLLCPCIAVFCL
jgi:hypothetical protein